MQTVRFNGMSKHPLYPTWRGMIDRCHNKNSKNYIRYGRRGISVCDEWRYNFLQFIKDMGDKPEGCSIDRIDNNGNYEQSNCRWATREQQDENRRPGHECAEERELIKEYNKEKRGALKKRVRVLQKELYLARQEIAKLRKTNNSDETIKYLNGVISNLRIDKKKAINGMRILPVLDIELK